MNTKQTDALKLALEALEIEESQTAYPGRWLTNAITAIREALAQPEQEPVAWMWRCKPYCDWPNWSVSLKRPADSGRDGHKRTEGYEDMPLYTTPPHRKPLTDEHIKEGWRKLPIQAPMSWSAYLAGARMAEAAHGIKGEA